MLRMLLVSYLNAIRSERRLCDEVHLDLAYRWLCRLGLNGTVPDHSTLTENRHGRFRESGVFRRPFEEVVARCLPAGLVVSRDAAVDGSVVTADANSRRRRLGDEPPQSWGDRDGATQPMRE